MWQAKVVSSAACGTLVAPMCITNNLSHKQLVVSLDVMYNNQTSISVFTFYRQSPR